MRTTLFLMLFFWWGQLAHAQNKPSCCAAPDAFAALASLSDFRDAHVNPLPYAYSDSLGKSITFKATDGREAYGFEIRSAKPSNKWLFVFHEWWGLNDYVKKECVRYYKDLGDVNVLAIDLYDRKVATTKEEAGKLMQGVTGERAVQVIEGAMTYTGTDTRIATLGWCFGGGWSLQASLFADQQASGCVMFYGQPEASVERLKELDTEVLAIFATQDKWLTPAVAKKFEQNMKAAGKKLTLKSYNADHAFANPSSPNYKSKEAQEAYAVSLAFLKKALQ